MRRRILGNSSLEVADFMHGPHDDQLGKSRVDQSRQKSVMARKIAHMGEIIVVEAIPPCKMDADIRAAQLSKEIPFCGKEIDFSVKSLRVLSIKTNIGSHDLAATVKELLRDMSSDIAIRSCYKYFHLTMQLLFYRVPGISPKIPGPHLIRALRRSQQDTVRKQSSGAAPQAL